MNIRETIININMGFFVFRFIRENRNSGCESSIERIGINVSEDIMCRKKKSRLSPCKASIISDICMEEYKSLM
jgi:hypothetical protein